MIKSAHIEGEYRYTLLRQWDANPLAVWIMLNPSTADSETDDPTITRCINFAKSWGCGGVKVVNLFALRATKPAELKQHPDPIGPANDRWLSGAYRTYPTIPATIIIAAWGTKGALFGRGAEVLKTIQEMRTVNCLGQNADGSPCHPLYLKASTSVREIR